MNNKKSKLFSILVWIFVIIVVITFVLTYPSLAKETGKALVKTTGLVIKKGVDIAKGSEVATDIINDTVKKTIEVVG